MSSAYGKVVGKYAPVLDGITLQSNTGRETLPLVRSLVREAPFPLAYQAITDQPLGTGPSVPGERPVWPVNSEMPLVNTY